MLRRAWKPIVGTAVLVGAPSYLYYRSRQQPRETFDLAVKVKGPDGQPSTVTRTISMLSMEQVDARLNEHAQAITTPRPGIVWKQTTAHLAANDPIEDANASKIVQRDPSADAPPGDLLFFTVMDGHGGPHTSQLLSKVLIPAVALELNSLIKDNGTAVPKASMLASVKSLLWPTAAAPAAVGADPNVVSLAIQRAFTNLDFELVNAPLRILADALSKQTTDKTAVPDLSQHPMALATMLPAISGSCAIMALFDTAHNDLYVACTGDSRAVAGVWEETEDGKGQWRVDVLSEDQTGRNPNELKRMQSEHPPNEADTVIMRGRVLGGLEPTRAFGDARYKWPRDIQNLLNKAFLEGNDRPMRGPSSLLQTPPYVTSCPVVTHRKLSFHPSDDPNKPKPTFRFLVLATDGLWDQLTSEEVVALVGGHLTGLKGTIPKSSLNTLVPTVTDTATVEGKDKRPTSKEGSWAFVDDNISTHLIRNAFGGGDKTHLRQLLSIPAPLARSYRDDVTCTVVYWEDGRESEAKAATFTDSAKAKL